MKFERRINYYETDKMGIVHHSNYIRYFEEARVFLLDNGGLGYDKVEEMGIISPVLGVSLDYKQSLTFGDEIVVDTHLVHFDGIRMTIEYKAYRKADMALATVGESKHCFLDAATRRPVNLKRKMPELYNKFSELLK